MKFETITLPILVLSTLGLAACGGSSSGDDSGLDDLVNEPQNPAPPETTIDAADDNDAEDASPGEVPPARASAVNTADTGSNPLFYATGNNSAYLTGPVFGTGELADSELVEKLEIFGQVGDASESYEAVYAVQDLFDVGIAELITVVHNTRDRPECGATFEINVVKKDGSLLTRPGDDRPVNYRGRVVGSSFDTSETLPNGGLDTDQCVGPGEIVFGRIIITDSDTDGLTTFGDQAGITGGTRIFGPGAQVDFPAMEPVIPLSYTVNDEGNVELLVENQGNITILVDGRIYPLTPEGFPMSDISAQLSSIEEIAPGASDTLVFDMSRFQGSASSLRAVLDLDFIDQ